MQYGELAKETLSPENSTQTENEPSSLSAQSRLPRGFLYKSVGALLQRTLYQQDTS